MLPAIWSVGYLSRANKLVRWSPCLRHDTLRHDGPVKGIKVNNTNPVIRWENGQGNIADVSLSLSLVISESYTNFFVPQQLRAIGGQCKTQLGAHPNLIIVVLPEGGNDIYTAIKQYVDPFVQGSNFLTLFVVSVILQSVLLF